MNTELMFSSKKDDWETPQWLFDELDIEFHFTLDPCANELNHKCAKYFTKSEDGLSKCWKGETVFCNPPYGREIGSWVKRCYLHSRVGEGIAVMLIPARTDTIYRQRQTEKILYGLCRQHHFGKGRGSDPCCQ